MKRKRYAYEGTCPACNKKTKCHVEDFGIGSFEFWGARGVHHDYVLVSNCCREAVDDVETFELEPEPDDFF